MSRFWRRAYESTSTSRASSTPKTSVIDEAWAIIGSANLDYLSLFVNQELILIARDQALAETLHVQYQRDLGDAAELTLSVWRRRGWRERGLEALGRAARRLL